MEPQHLLLAALAGVAGWALFSLSLAAARRLTRRHAPQVQMPALQKRALQAALAVGDDHPLWRAVLQSIDVLEQQCVAETIDLDRQSQGPILHHYAGGAAHLRTLRGFLLEHRDKGLRNEYTDDGD